MEIAGMGIYWSEKKTSTYLLTENETCQIQIRDSKPYVKTMQSGRRKLQPIRTKGL